MQWVWHHVIITKLRQKFHHKDSPVLLSSHIIHIPNFYHYSLVLPVIKQHLIGLTHIPLCLTSFIQHSMFRSIHIPGINQPCCALHSILFYVSQFGCSFSTTNKHLGHSQFCTITNTFLMNSLANVFYRYIPSFFRGEHLGAKLLGQR